jgi:hypothetical protein
MEYMLLINAEGEPGSGTEEERAQMHAAFGKYTQDITASGVLVGGDRLQPPTAATTVRVQDGQTLTTDGPFAETKEWLAGYYKIDVETLDDAIEWASRIPSLQGGGSVEVRPVDPMPAEVPSSS